MFNYEKFENDVLGQMEAVLDKWAEEKDDLYIFSLDCARGMESIGVIANTTHYLEEQAEPDSEDYGYYKYCEEEWDLWYADGFVEDISTYMDQYLKEKSEHFTDPETFEFLESFDEHCSKMIESCKKALVRLRQSVKQDFPNLLLTYNIREYLDNEERTEIFALVNSSEASEEYAEHIEDFN